MAAVRFDPESHTVHAAGRSWPADPSGTEIHDLEAGYVHRTRRCLVRFESGWSASIVWGSCTYSSNHDSDLPWLDGVAPFTEEPATVEVGVIDITGELRMRDGGPEAYLDDAELASLFDFLEHCPTEFDYGERPPSLEEVERSVGDVMRLRDPLEP